MSRSRLRKTYRFVRGSRLERRGNDVEKVVKELEKVKAERKVLDAEVVVQAARSNRSPLHRYFEWDDRKAAHQHRLEQARKLLRSIEVVVDDAPPVRAFLTVEEPAEGLSDYRSTVTIMQDEEDRTHVLLRAYRELVSWRNRYADLKTFAGVFAEVDRLPLPPKLKKIA